MATVFQTSNFEPNETRENMKPSSMEPDDARRFIRDLMVGVYNRVRSMPKENFTRPNPPSPSVSNSERAKQYYGYECYQLLSGIEAALNRWDESGQDVKELKQQYSGTFVEGVEIGERLAVYEGTDFTFTKESSDENSSGFTFTKNE